jgi:hypothetical protein
MYIVMSWGTCYSGSNNIHFDFPPIMADGRHYTNWQPGTKISEDIRAGAGIKSNWQYRKYLQDNADTIVRHNQLSACDNCSATVGRYGIENSSKNSPYLYTTCTDSSRPFGYENSDLKSLYVSSHQLQSRMVTPVITQADLIKSGYKSHN